MPKSTINPAFFTQTQLHSPSRSLFIGSMFKNNEAKKNKQNQIITIRTIKEARQASMKNTINIKRQKQYNISGTKIQRIKTLGVDNLSQNAHNKEQKLQFLQEDNNNPQKYFSQEGVKTKSLTFQYGYKKLEVDSISKSKRLMQKTSLQKFQSLKLSKDTTGCSLNQQMLESMKKYLRKLEKAKSVFAKRSLQNLSYGLDIKSIEAQKNISDEPKHMKLNLKSKQQIRSHSRLLSKKTLRSKTTVSENTCISDFSNLINNKIKSQIGQRSGKTLLSQKNRLKIDNSTPYKKQERTVKYRFDCMLKNSNLILNSHKVYLQIEESSIQNKFNYFIGFGNNKNLIRSIMKKRWWWNEVFDISKANFVWTQLKVPSIVQNLPQQKQNKNSNFTTQTIQTIQTSQNIVDQKINSPQFVLSKQTQDKMLIAFPKKVIQLLEVQKNSYQNIFHTQSRIQDLKIYKKGKYSSYFSQINVPQVFHNHYKNNSIFGNKNALYHSLKKYYQFSGENLFSIIPKTFYLQKFNKTLFNQFQKHTQQKQKSKKNVWILKPAQNSNRGQGISLHSDLKAIKQIVNGKKGGKFIIQQYLKNPFLYNRRKFDIRTYMAMITIGKVTKLYWYNEGYLRTSSQIFTHGKLDNIFVHLTNDAIQCDSQKYGKYQAGNKVSYNQFQRYLQLNHPGQNLNVQNLNKKMKNIALKSVEAIYPKVIPNLDSSEKNFTFQLFGLDFLIDSKFQPWLLEINTNPCLELSCPALQRIIPRMLENLFRISLDSIFQAPSTANIPKSANYFIYDNLFQMNKFELIFDSYYDRNKQWENYCLNNRDNDEDKQQYQDETQVFYNEGMEISGQSGQSIEL